MRQDLANGSAPIVADLAVRWVKPLIARAGAVINGTESEQHATGSHDAPQTVVDALLAR
jgi:hypothetical protein